MDDLAQLDGVTPAERGERARAAFDLYAATYTGAQISDLVINLAHLADVDGTGGHNVLRDAERHYEAELPDEDMAAAAESFDPYRPAPGTEYPFSISDIARATAQLLGDDWMAESGSWGVCGVVAGPHSTEFTFCVDDEDDLVIEYRYSTDDDFPEHPELPEDVLKCDAGVYLLASASEGLDALAERSAAAIRAITGA